MTYTVLSIVWKLRNNTHLYINLRRSRDGTVFVCACVRVLGSIQFTSGSFYADCPHKRITVVPVMNGHPRDQAKVSVHDRWPLIGGTGGRRQTQYTLHDYITTSDNDTEYNVIIMYAIVIEPKINAS